MKSLNNFQNALLSDFELAHLLKVLILSKQNINSMFVIYVLCLSVLSCMFIAALWSPAGKGLTSWLSCV